MITVTKIVERPNGGADIEFEYDDDEFKKSFMEIERLKRFSVKGSESL